jgi:hypothetical protein
VALKVRGFSKFETKQYGHESHGTQTRERLSWRYPATTGKYRTDLSSETASLVNKPVNVENN